MEILPGVHRIPGVRWSRAYLIEDHQLTLVDAGLPWHAGKVLDYIRSIGHNPDDLAFILMTHSHPDHSGGALTISRRTGAKIVAHANDTKTHSNREVSLSYMGAFGSLGVPLPFLRRMPVSHVVSDGQSLSTLSGFSVIHTPGHTPGSVCYLLEERKLLFSGDTLMSNGARLSRSVPFPGYDRRLYRESLEKLAGIEFDTLCGGHGAPLVGQASERLRELLEAKPNPPTWVDIFKNAPRRLVKSRGLMEED